MSGTRAILAGTLTLFAVAFFAPQQAQPLLLNWVDAGQGLHVMHNEVSIAQWRQCVSEHGCSFMPRPGLGAIDDGFPVTGIGALDAQEFVVWASMRMGRKLRLPTLEEWYRFSEVPSYKPEKIFTDPRLAWAASYGKEGTVDPTLKRRGGFGQNSKGVADVKGNVWEWTSSCVMNQDAAHCPAFFAAGTHDAKIPVFVRDPSSGGCATGTPPAHIGMRLLYQGSIQSPEKLLLVSTVNWSG
jgi:formylglycine-generating enzyme required for sulfatase activity